MSSDSPSYPALMMFKTLDSLDDAVEKNKNIYIQVDAPSPDIGFKYVYLATSRMEWYYSPPVTGVKDNFSIKLTGTTPCPKPKTKPEADLTTSSSHCYVFSSYIETHDPPATYANVKGDGNFELYQIHEDKKYYLIPVNLSTTSPTPDIRDSRVIRAVKEGSDDKTDYHVFHLSTDP